MQARTWWRKAWIAGLVLLIPLVVLGGLIALLATTAMLGRSIGRPAVHRRIQLALPTRAARPAGSAQALSDGPPRAA
ncbi:MAG: hypothetical protein QOD76_1448 [Solirubrobacteraceae bacterium]|nr:hypothetical protein [Solirubrobacteraceae bacterium]